MSNKAPKVVIELKVNGEEHDILVPPHLTLLEALREKLELTGTKEGCGEGVCGSCTVLMDGRPVRSCLTLAVEAVGHEITTIEGLAGPEGLHRLQDSFVRHGAIQCGFCTPGMILTAKALLDEIPRPGEQEAREAIAANICRCTGYTKIVEAIVAAGGDDDA
jgi:aerobic carbon-monoxide dehydrogenase small subunit